MTGRSGIGRGCLGFVVSAAAAALMWAASPPAAAHAAAVFGVAGVLANLPPPAGMASHHEGADLAETAAGEGIEVSGSDFATTMRVTLRIDPGTVGKNHFTVQIADYDTGEPLDAVRVALRFAIPDQPDLGPAMLELRSTSDGQWEGAGTALSQPARWQAAVVIAFASDGAEIPLEFDVGAGGSVDD